MMRYQINRCLLDCRLLPLLFAILAGGCGLQQERSPTISEPFPDLRLQGIGRSDLTLADLRGKTVVLNVWAPWCAPCIAEMPSLDALSRSLSPERYQVIGVTVDDRFLAEEFINDHGIGFANYFDADRRQVEGEMGVSYFPQTFIISPEGVLIERVVGYREWNREHLMKILGEGERERALTALPVQNVDEIYE